MHYWCPLVTNNLPENRVSKTNVDVVDKKVNSELKLSAREVCVPHGHPISCPEGAKRIGCNEAFPFHMKNSFQKILKLVFKLGVYLHELVKAVFPLVHE